MANSPANATTLQKPHILLVEGADDEQLFKSLMRKMTLPETIQIVNLGGRDNLRDRLKAVSITGDDPENAITSVAIVLDAEDNPAGTKQAIQDAFKSVNFSVPSQSLEVAVGKPRTLFMIMPDDNTPGMLEDICLQAFADDPAMKCVDEFDTCVEDQTFTSKARLRALLASKPRAETRLGIASQQRWWPLDHTAFDPMRELLTKLTN